MYTKKQCTFQVMNDRVEFGVAGGYVVLMKLLMDLSAFLGSSEARFATRSPRPKMTLENLWRPFPLSVWIFFAASLLSISIYLKVAYCAYNAIPTRRHLMVKQENNWMNFLIYPFCKITEPGIYL